MATDPGPAAFARSVPDQRPGVVSIGTATGYRAAYCPEIDEAELIGRYVPLVKRIAAHLKGRLPETVQLDDLVQAGLIAVLRIGRRGGMDPSGSPGLRRSIVNAMIDEARREVWAPVRTVRLAKSAAQAMRATKRRLGRDASDDEIAAEMGLKLREYHAALTEIAGIRLLNVDDFDESDDDSLRVIDNRDIAIDRSRLLSALTQSIGALPDREKLVMSLYYEQELNMEEVGKVLGLDKSTVCRVHGRALLMLRAALGDWIAAGSEQRRAVAGG